MPPAIRPYKQTMGGGAGDDMSGDEQANKADDAQGADDRAGYGESDYRLKLNREQAESRFTQEELTKIQVEFERLSKDNVIGKRKLLEYFRLVEINETYMANEVFFTIKNSTVINTPIDYSKFILFVAIISKGSREEKLQLLFTFFDKSCEESIMRDDMKAHIAGTILSMQ